MFARWLGIFLAFSGLIQCGNAHGGGSYQVPPSGAPRQDTYNSVPIRQQEQTYGTPPPRAYNSPSPPPAQEQQRNYETPTAPAQNYEAPRTPAPAHDQQRVYETPTPSTQPPPVVQDQQRVYETPTPSTPAPIVREDRVYETPPPACPHGGRRHPATGECLVNECETGQHDCDRNAKCIDTFDSYTCACQSGYIDESAAEKPGRVCSLPQTNNCASGRSGCSPDAICTDTYNGPTCKCKLGYVDLSENSRSKAGQTCKKLVNECEDPSLNTCSKDADCHDTFDSYTCTCKTGFKDVDPSNAGRECQLEAESNPLTKVSPCEDPTKNECHKNAVCVEDSNKTEGYTCRCKDGYSDKSPDPLLAGRVCEATPRCGADSDCDPAAACINTDSGFTCACPVGMQDISPDKDTKPGRKCEKTVDTTISIVVVRDGNDATPFSSKYSNLKNKPAEEIAEIFSNDLGKTISDTKYGPAYIKTNVTKIASPKSVQPQLDDGIIITGTVSTKAASGAVNACELFDAVVEKIQSSGGYVGNGQLKVGDDVQKLNPCPKPLCGGKICNAALGEVCINGECMTDYCVDNFCPVNATCINRRERAECVCKPGFVDIRNVSQSIRTSAGYNQDQYCLRGVDVDYCALGLHDCHAAATCIPLRGNYTCKCNDDQADQNVDLPGRICVGAAAFQPSTLPWWLMLLLALLFLLLTLCCCLWALSRLRWFRHRRGIADAAGSSYSDLVIPRPKIRSLDAESMGSGSSEFTIREEVERRVITDVTRTELHTQETEEEANEHEKYTHTESVHQERMVR